MKKLIYSSLIMALTGAGLLACKKENIQVVKTQELDFNNEYHVASDDRMLVFQSSEDYHNIVSNTSEEGRIKFLSFVEKMPFKSMAETGTKSLSNNFLSQLLNTDGVTRIGDYLYKVDVVKEKVGVLHYTHASHYFALIQLSASNPHIRLFSTDEDVIELAESGVASSLGCQGHKNIKLYNRTTVNGASIQINVAQENYGIYFENYAEMWAYGATQYLDWTKLEIYGPECWGSKNCNGTVTHTKPSGDKFTILHTDIPEKKFKFYSGEKSLKGIFLFARYRTEYTPPAGAQNSYLKLKEGDWVGINYNSPYSSPLDIKADTLN